MRGIRIKYVFIGLAVFLIAISLVSLKVGAVPVPLPRLLSLLACDSPRSAEEATLGNIVFKIRLPRLLLAIAVGGGLSVAGVLFQGLFRNPLVEPYTLGVSGGAALGVSVAVLFGSALPWAFFPLFGFAGAFAAVLTAYAIARRKYLKISYLLLVGVMISFISSSIIMLLMSVSNLSQFRAIVFWSMGSLDIGDPALLKICGPVIVLASLVSYGRAWSLNALALGEEGAAHLGINLEKEKTLLFLLGSLIAGAAVAAAGGGGLVGRLVPHFMRIFVGGDHRALLPASFLAGAGFLAGCDILARIALAPAELPVGVITGVLGGSAFIAALWKKNRENW